MAIITNKRKLFLKVITAITYLLFLILAGLSNNKAFSLENPYPETIPICFLPYLWTEIYSDQFINLHKEVAGAVVANDYFKYFISVPENGELEEDLNEGFIARNDEKRITPKYPISKYWRNKGIRYVIFGYYKINDKEFLLEMNIFDVHYDFFALTMHYKGITSSDYNEIKKRMKNTIIEFLSENQKYWIQLL